MPNTETLPKTPKKPKKKEVCRVYFVRENGTQALSIKVTKQVENLFKTDEIKTSDRYKDIKGNHLKYYALSELFTEYIKKYNLHRSTDRAVVLQNYGTDFLRNGDINLSILRTVDIRKGIIIVVDGLIFDSEIQEWVRNLTAFVKFLYVTFIEKTEVKAVINLEV